MLGYNEKFSHIIYGHTHRRWPRAFLKRKKPVIQQNELFQIEDTLLFNTGA